MRLLIGAVLLLSMQACLKSTDEAAVPDPAIPFKGTDITGTLAAESSLQLFNKAYKRLALEKEVTNDAGYTIFAPVDSAMKAAGLDETSIDKMNIDSLRRRIAYQIVMGSLTKAAIHNQVTASYMTTLDRVLVTGSSGSTAYVSTSLYVKEDDQLYMNGSPVTQRNSAITATNGYVYPVSAFVSRLPEYTLLDVISTDPELSLYYEALQIQDEILGAAGAQGDIQLFSDKPATTGMYPTVLAPTNKAFEAAGFHTADDIREYASSTYVGNDPDTYFPFYFSPMDTVLRKHILYNQSVANSFLSTRNTVRIFYSDFLRNEFNNGKINTYDAFTDLFLPALRYDHPLTFSVSGGEAYVKYDRDPATAPVRIPRDASRTQPVNNYITANGSLYKIDKLFYPANK